MSRINTYRATGSWEVQTYNTGSSAWEAVTKWPAASVDSFKRRYFGTSTIIDLADGSRGMFTPSTHKNIEPIALTWHPRTVTSTFRTNLKAYLTDHTGVKVTLHDSTIIEGYIMYIDEEFPLSGDTQIYGLMIELHPFDVDASGSISE